MFIYILIAIPVLWYLGVPLLIKSSLKINARPELRPVTPKFLPEDVQDYFNVVGPRLSALGFEPGACFVMENALPNVTPHVQLWLNRKTGQAASANVLITPGQGERPPIIKTHVELVTKLADGPAIVTNNSPDLGAFKKTAASDTISATRLKDPNHLYRLHAWREAKLADASAERVLPAVGEELNWFADVYEETIVRQVKTGYLQADASDPTVYVPTMLGAYMMTWSEQAPMKGMRRRAEDRRAEEQVRQCATVTGGGTVMPPTNVRIAVAAARTDNAGPNRRAA